MFISWLPCLWGTTRLEKQKDNETQTVIWEHHLLIGNVYTDDAIVPDIFKENITNSDNLEPWQLAYCERWSSFHFYIFSFCFYTCVRVWLVYIHSCHVCNHAWVTMEVRRRFNPLKKVLRTNLRSSKKAAKPCNCQTVSPLLLLISQFKKTFLVLSHCDFLLFLSNKIDLVWILSCLNCCSFVAGTHIWSFLQLVFFKIVVEFFILIQHTFYNLLINVYS